ncbi:hypothetical protein GCM10010967_33980 [Dyadobacter beijingensis]|uniref:Uncharacterized protein n=1 Tax=Dyadobacter beijingensis TaxID=365489 RepID=A0ABQ2I3P1_9BACT|nr:hypothetical protein [Dyadobacter beijingensis]GGM97394.1 hypothetical protein GCM10010967_33980 [Dyadobacter beijingensis]
MEHSPVALFQILYQHETLFQLEDRLLPVTPAVEEPQPEPPIPTPATVQADAPTLPATPAIPASALPATPTVQTPPATPAIAAQPPAQAAPAQTPVPPAVAFPALNHKVLVLIDEEKQEEMIMSEALFLDSILKAVGHSLETSDILNFSYLPGQDARTVLSGKKTNFFISFGVPLIKLHLDLLLVPYTHKMVEGIWFLLADPLVVVEADRNLKKKLWQALQKMFEIS